MALSRIGNTTDLIANFSRISQAASSTLGEMQCTRYAAVHQSRLKALHVTCARRYPDPPTLPLPVNVSEIFANETGRFTPERTRDIAAPVLLYSRNNANSSLSAQTKQSFDRSSIPPIRVDTHVNSYDCFGAVSLSGTMQSNVPKPFCSTGKSNYLNMPGGQWTRDGKYIAENLQNTHYRSTRLSQFELDEKNGPTIKAVVMSSSLLQKIHEPRYIFRTGYATSAPEQPKNPENLTREERAKYYMNMSKKEKFRRALKDYGATLVVFHVGISLISLGACYSAVISGLDLMPIVQKITGGGNEQLEKIMSNSSEFILAYTVHKCFAPFRISITLAVTPILVRRLRRMGILKPPKIKTIQ